MPKEVNVVVARGFGSESNRRIAGVSGRIRVSDVSDYTTVRPGQLGHHPMPLLETASGDSPPGNPAIVRQLKRVLTRADVVLGMVMVSNLFCDNLRRYLDGLEMVNVLKQAARLLSTG